MCTNSLFSMTMRKLCFVTYQFKTGGVERIFSTLASQFPNYKISLLTVTNQYDSMIENIPANVEIIPLHHWTYFRFLASMMKRCSFMRTFFFMAIIISEIVYMRLFSRWKDYTYINFSDTISSLFITYFSGKGKKYSWIHYNPRTINSSRYSFLYKAIYKRMHRIVCICEEQKNLMLSVVPNLDEKKISVIYNAIDVTKISSLKNEIVPFNFNYILMVARFDFRSKDFHTLIDAYCNLNVSLKSENKLVFVGDGPDMCAVKEYVKNRKESCNIFFIGLQTNPYKWINKAKMLVLSSKSEGLPTVLLEAFACGTPVISTKCETGPSEILDNGRCGFLIKIGDVQSLTMAMKKILLDHNKANEFIQNGFVKIQEFLPERIIPKIEKLWTN